VLNRSNLEIRTRCDDDDDDVLGGIGTAAPSVWYKVVQI